MAVGTDFSVTKKATKPVVNPAAPIDKPALINSETGTPISEPDTISPQDSQGVSSPSVVLPESAPTHTAPVVLTANPGTLTTPPFPLNHARIMYDNLLLSAQNVYATSGQNPNYARIPNTADRWTFGGGGDIIFDLPVNYPVDTICVGYHNLGESDYTIGAEWSPDLTGSSWFALTPGKVPTNNNDMMFHNSAGTVSARRIRVVCSGTGSARYIGYISAGVALQMQRPFFNGHTPITDSDVTEYFHNRSESGNIIGQEIRRQGYKTNAEWKNLDDTWYRTYFAPFKQVAKLKPFFFAWDLLEYPEDVGLCRVAKDISAPMQNGFGVKRSVTIELLGA